MDLLNQTLNNLDQGITVFDAKLRLIAFNDKVCELLELPRTVMKTGMHISELFMYNARQGEYGPGDTKKLVQEQVNMALRFEPRKFERVRPDEKILEIIEKPLSRGGIVTIYTDITRFREVKAKLRRSHDELEKKVDERTAELRKIPDQLRKLSITDPLTSLFNRRGFNEYLHQTLKRIKRNEQICGLIYMDLDNFKSVNDKYGHEIGDLILIEVSKRIKYCLRETDCIARFGGDEFVALLEPIKTKKEAKFIVNRIIDQLSKPIIRIDVSVKIGVSVGISYIHGNMDDMTEALRSADNDMYKNKRIKNAS